MAKQTFTTGQVLTAAQMTSLQQTAMGGGDTTAKTASYVLVAADAGTTVAMNSGSATTITVNTSLFSAGDSLYIQNRGAGVCTITAGTATVTTASSLALAQYEGGTLYFTGASASIFFKSDGAAATSGSLTLLSTTNLTSTSTIISGISGSYTDLMFWVQDVQSTSTTGDLQFDPNGSTGISFLTGIRGTTTGNITDLAMSFNRSAEQIATTNTNASYVLYIYNYASASYNKPFVVSGNATSSVDTTVNGGGSIRTTSAITSMTLKFRNGQTFAGGRVLTYGVK